MGRLGLVSRDVQILHSNYLPTLMQMRYRSLRKDQTGTGTGTGTGWHTGSLITNDNVTCEILCGWSKGEKLVFVPRYRHFLRSRSFPSATHRIVPTAIARFSAVEEPKRRGLFDYSPSASCRRISRLPFVFQSRDLLLLARPADPRSIQTSKSRCAYCIIADCRSLVTSRNLRARSALVHPLVAAP
jgi:hypothetical protein